MKIAIASGKGGTGKTTVAVNLALCAGEPVHLLDCDVEAPNCHLFLNPTIEGRFPVTVPVPRVDLERCNGCGACGDFCQFNAIVSFGTEPLIFPELCHGCGGCVRACPQGALSEVDQPIGEVEVGTAAGGGNGAAGSIRFTGGRLSVGQPMSPPVIKGVRARAAEDSRTLIIDCPPGTSCPVIAAIKDVDFVLLVTDPTPFGLYDLKLAVAVTRHMGLPFGVVLNRWGVGDDRVERYLEEEGIALLLRIPDDPRIARAYAEGRTIAEALPEMAGDFSKLYRKLARWNRHEEIAMREIA